MPKLNTTIDNLELKSNKVFASVPDSTWTDEQYPSAKTLYSTYSYMLNKIYPVGSLLINSTTANPESTLGGTWEEAGRAFTNSIIAPNSYNSYGTITNFIGSSVKLENNTLLFTLKLVIANTISCHTGSTFTIGRLDPSKFGVTAFLEQSLPLIASTDNNYIASIQVSSNGEFTLKIVQKLNSGSLMESGTTFNLCFEQHIESSNMLTNFCDKFYWKRTA